MPGSRKTGAQPAGDEKELGELRVMDMTLGHAIALLQDAERSARRINRTTLAHLIADSKETLQDKALTLVRQGIAEVQKKMAGGAA